MQGNWSEPREKLLEVATDLVVRRGYTMESVADTMASHYHGASRAAARGQFLRELKQRIRQVPAEEWPHMQRFKAMRAKADELEAEGWKFLRSDEQQPGGFWYHRQSGVSVNNLGGDFRSWEEATERAFNSACRDWVRKHSN